MTQVFILPWCIIRITLCKRWLQSGNTQCKRTDKQTQCFVQVFHETYPRV